MITVSVPSEPVRAALGDVGADVTVIAWNPAEDECPDGAAAEISVACIEHYSGGRRVFDRLAQLPRLEVVQIPSAGYEHALPFVPPGVALANARGVHDSRVAEFAVGMALAHYRLMPRFWDAQSRGEWEPEYFNENLADKRALVVGYGSIGSAIGARLRAMEVDVEGVARTARTAEDGTTVHAIADVRRELPRFDLVVVVTPHNTETDKLVGADFLAAMADGALLINVGRGKCVDTDALLAELDAGRLCAALDVTDPEPLPAGHPLFSAPGCTIYPHISGGTPTTDRRYVGLVRRQIEAMRAGRPFENVVAVGPYESAE